MKIGTMNQEDQIRIQEFRIHNQDYTMRWMASVRYSDLLVCLKSSWLSYEEWIGILQEHGHESPYQGKNIYWQKVARQTSLQIPTALLKPPVDGILLPLTGDGILLPADLEEGRELQKTIKGVIGWTKTRKRSLWNLCKAAESLVFYNDSLPVQKGEIVAEYSVGSFSYPVTAAMLGRPILVQVPKKFTCQPRIAERMSSKYYLKERGE